MGIGFKELLIVAVIVIVIFGSKRLRHMGGDLGSAIKGFRNAMKNDEDDESDKAAHTDEGQAHGSQSRVIDQDTDEKTHHADEPASHDHKV